MPDSPLNDYIGADDDIDERLSEALIGENTALYSSPGQRNNANWLYGQVLSSSGQYSFLPPPYVDLTCIPASNSTYAGNGFTLISPLHVCMAGDPGRPVSPPPDGTELVFYTHSDAAITRTIISHVDIPIIPSGVDAVIRIGVLGRPVPSSIIPAKVLPVFYERQQLGRLVAIVDQTQNAYVGEIARGSPIAEGRIIGVKKSDDSRRAIFWKRIGFPFTTDYGMPFFIIQDNELIFLGPLAEDASACLSIAAYHEQINAAMAALSNPPDPVYQLTDFSKAVLPPRIHGEFFDDIALADTTTVTLAWPVGSTGTHQYHSEQTENLEDVVFSRPPLGGQSLIYRLHATRAFTLNIPESYVTAGPIMNVEIPGAGYYEFSWSYAAGKYWLRTSI